MWFSSSFNLSSPYIEYVRNRLASNLNKSVGYTGVDKTSLSSFISHNQDKVLILLDGFDELKTPALDKALFGSILRILNRKKDRECYVVVTTRPSHYHKLVTKSLIRGPFTQVRVEGFDEEDIEKYVTQFFSEEHNKAERLVQRMRSSNVLSDLAKSPMLLMLMCILWRDNSTLPETMSRIYSEALEYIFHRKTDMSPDEISKVTNELGKTGLRGLLAPEQQLAFPEEEFEPRVLESAIKAGILTRQKVLKGMKSQNSIQFLHKTFQEFCAGKYLQSLLETDTVEFNKILKQMINSGGNDMEYALRFCAGDNVAITSSILQTLAASDQFKQEQQRLGAKGLRRKNAPLMQLGLDCYFEGQSKYLPPVEFVESVLTDCIVIYEWNRDSLNSFTHFLRNVHTHTMENKQTDYLDKVQSVEIKECPLGLCMSDLADCMSVMVNLSSVRLDGCFNGNSEEYAALSAATSYPGGSAALLAHHFKKMKNLQMIHIKGQFTDEDLNYIAPALCNLPNLVELKLWGIRGIDGSAASWADHFKKMNNLQKLDFSWCLLTGEDMTHIAPALCDLPNLVELKLWGNTRLGGSVRTWAHHFKKMKNLQKLGMGSCKLTGEDIAHLASALCDTPNFVELVLWLNDSLSGSARTWTDHFKKMKNLQKLDMGNCKWTGEAMTHIVPALCDLPHLVELNLSKNEYLAGSAASWAHHFKEMKNLKKLDFSSCKFTDEDMTHIDPALCDLTNLVDLHIEQ